MNSPRHAIIRRVALYLESMLGCIKIISLLYSSLLLFVSYAQTKTQLKVENLYDHMHSVESDSAPDKYFCAS